MLQSYDYYIKKEQREASEENAPIDAVYKSHDGKWVTIKECSESCQKRVQEVFNRL